MSYMYTLPSTKNPPPNSPFGYSFSDDEGLAAIIGLGAPASICKEHIWKPRTLKESKSKKAFTGESCKACTLFRIPLNEYYA